MNPHASRIDIRRIQQILPHGYPFLLIDRIIEMEKDHRIVALKNVTINEPFFGGHFPGSPIMPGVLIVESMAQTGAFLMLDERPDIDGKLVYFIGIDRVRFRQPIIPGDQMFIEVEVLRTHKRACKMAGKVKVDGKVAAEAVLLSTVVDR